MAQAQQVEFQANYIRVALVTAIFGGFALAGHLCFVMGFDRSLGDGYASLIQIHGHLQLLGWAGLFIIGISFHIIPRLSSVRISQPQWTAYVLWLIGIGFATTLHFPLDSTLPW